jgi:hypothetical protein
MIPAGGTGLGNRENPMLLNVSAALRPASVTVPDPDAAARKWKHVKRLPLAHRLAYLQSPDAIDTMDAKVRSERLRGVQLAIDQALATVPGDSWAVAIVHHGLKLPLALPDPDRPHAVHLKLSRAKTRVGADGKSSRRWTPPQCVALEDFLDSLDPMRAAFHDYPQSPSAVVIQRIELTRGKATNPKIGYGRRR